MSYDLGLRDAITGESLTLDVPHQMRGGNYAIGGSPTADINITYNYSTFFYKVIPEGIRSLYGMTGADSIPVLESAISQLGDDVSKDYWKATEGNAKRALMQCLALAKMRPDGVWDGD
jgi:hypothetical protein